MIISDPFAATAEKTAQSASRIKGVDTRFHSRSVVLPNLPGTGEVFDKLGFPDLKLSIISIDVRTSETATLHPAARAIFNAYQTLTGVRYSQNGLTTEREVQISTERALRSYIFVVERATEPFDGNQSSEYSSEGPWVREHLTNGASRELLVLGGLTTYLYTNGSFFDTVFTGNHAPGIKRNWFSKLFAQRLPGIPQDIQAQTAREFMDKLPIIEFGKAAFAEPKMVENFLTASQRYNLALRIGLRKELMRRIKILGVKFALEDAAREFDLLAEQNDDSQRQGLVTAMGFENGDSFDPKKRKTLFKSGPIALIKLFRRLVESPEPPVGFTPVTAANSTGQQLPGGLIEEIIIPRDTMIFNPRIPALLNGEKGFGREASGRVFAVGLYYNNLS